MKIEINAFVSFCLDNNEDNWYRLVLLMSFKILFIILLLLSLIIILRTKKF